MDSDEEDSDSGERRSKRKRRTWVIVVQGDVARGKMIRRMGLAGTDRTMLDGGDSQNGRDRGGGLWSGNGRVFGHGGDMSEWVCVNSTSVVRAKHGRRVLP